MLQGLGLVLVSALAGPFGEPLNLRRPITCGPQEPDLSTRSGGTPKPAIAQCRGLLITCLQVGFSACGYGVDLGSGLSARGRGVPL